MLGLEGGERLKCKLQERTIIQQVWLLRGQVICIFSSQGEIKDSWDLSYVLHIFLAIFPYVNESPQWFIRLVMLSDCSLLSLPSACWDHRPHEPSLSENTLHKSSSESGTYCISLGTRQRDHCLFLLYCNPCVWQTKHLCFKHCCCPFQNPSLIFFSEDLGFENVMSLCGEFNYFWVTAEWLSMSELSTRNYQNVDHPWL